MILSILIALAVIVAGFVIFVAMRPSEFKITRSATIPAPASVVFEQVNDFHNWKAWSPWARMDPDAKNTYSGAPSGVGAGFGWAGNNKVGEGKMTIMENKPGQYIRIKLEFIQPFQATHTAEFTFQPSGDQTVMSWTMSGTNSFMAKLVGLFMNCEQMIGGQFEQGLRNLSEVTTTELTANR